MQGCGGIAQPRIVSSRAQSRDLSAVGGAYGQKLVILCAAQNLRAVGLTIKTPTLPVTRAESGLRPDTR